MLKQLVSRPSPWLEGAKPLFPCTTVHGGKVRCAIVVERATHVDELGLAASAVGRLAFLGNHLRCDIRVASSIVLGEIPSLLEAEEGREITFQIPPDRIRVFVE